jgi:ATP-dependent Clp protease ATP-binding subunit ClpC
MKGKIKLGKLKQSIDLILDLDDLLYYRGKRAESIRFQKTLGWLIFLIALIILGVYILAVITVDTYSFQLNEPSSLVLSLIIFFLGYTMYLNRDRSKFGERFEKHSLKSLRKEIDDNSISKIEVENYFSDEVLTLIEEGYSSSTKDFLYEVSLRILNDHDISRMLMSRIGVSSKALSARLITETSNKSFKDVIGNLCIHLFEEGLSSGVDLIEKKLMLAILAKYFWKDTIVEYGISSPQLEGLIGWIVNESYRKYYKTRWRYLARLKPIGSMNLAYTSRSTSVLDKFARDYTAEIVKNGFVLSLGKDDYLNGLMRNLQKGKGSAVLIHGNTGVGKTFLIKHLATRMVIEDVPPELKDHRLLVIDTNAMLAKVSTDEEIENIFLKIFEEARASGNIILVFENFGAFISSTVDSNRRLVNILSGLIRDSIIKIICISSSHNFSGLINQDSELYSIFEKIEILEPAPEISFQILIDEASKLSEEHKVEIHFDAIQRVVESAPKIDHDRSMPDMGINMLEEVCVFAEAYGLKFVDKTLVSQLLAKKYGVRTGDVSASEGSSLINLEETLHKRIVGQERAVSAVAAAVRRIRSGLSNDNKPSASFLFFGPSGVGKTELAKALADLYFGHVGKLVRFDMSEFHEDKNLSRLIGFKDEFGKYNGGMLTDSIRQQPFSLLLFDEIEKAHPKVLDLFLQILDEGVVTDGSGRKVDFRNTIIVATSNAGSKDIAELVEQGNPYRVIENRAQEILRISFRTEFLNRFDSIIMFKTLNKLEIQKISEKMLQGLNERLSEEGVTISWDNQSIEELVSKGYNPVMGAREMRRTIQEEIENKVADAIVAKKVERGQTIYFKGLTISDIV